MYLVVDEITENPMVLDEPMDLSSTIPATDDTDLVIPESVRKLRFRGTARKEADRVLLAGRLTGALELRCAPVSGDISLAAGCGDLPDSGRAVPGAGTGCAARRGRGQG